MNQLYTNKMLDYFYAPTNAGVIRNASGVGVVINKETNEVFKLYLSVMDNIIVDAKFQTYGSVLPVAIMSVLTEMIINKKINDVKNLSIYDIVTNLGQVPKSKFNILFDVTECLSKAIKTYEKKLNKQIESQKNGENIKISDPISKSVNYDFIAIKNSIIDRQSKIIKEEAKEVEKEVVVLTPEEEFAQNKQKEKKARLRQQKSLKTSINSQFADEKSKKTTSKTVNNKNEINSEIKDNNIDKAINSKKTTNGLNIFKNIDNNTTNKINEVDEIDTITAKLSDALSNLNFKFDDNDNN